MSKAVKKRRQQRQFSNPLRERPQRKHKWRKFLLWLVIFILVLGAAYTTLVSNWFVVTKVEVEGSSQADISEQVYTYLNEAREVSFFNFIPGNHVMWLKTKPLRAQLLEDTYIAQIDFSKQLPDTLVVQVTEREPQLLYTFEGTSYLVDMAAEIIESVGAGDSGLGLPLVTSSSTDTVLGNLDQTKTAYIKIFYDEFPKYLDNVTLQSFELEQGSSEGVVSTAAGWNILIDTTGDPLVALSNLSRIYNEKISTSEKGSLEYIDVRLDNYVYYK